MPDVPDFRAGEALKAAELIALVNELVRQGTLTVAEPLGMSDGPEGIAIWADVPWMGWIRLTGGGTGGLYAWERVVGVTGGTWDVHPSGEGGGPGADDDPAFETNLNPLVPLDPQPVVEAWRDPDSNGLFFRWGSCPGG